MRPTQHRGGSYYEKGIFAIVLLAALALLATPGWAKPFLVCDPQLDVTHYIIDTDSATMTVPAVTGWIKEEAGKKKLYTTDPGGTRTPVHVLYDEGTLPPGAHVQKARACISAREPWSDELCSAESVPFAFTKPEPVTAPGAPVGLGFAKP